MSDQWIPDDEPKRSGKERWVRPKEWKEVKKDGQTMKVWRSRLVSRISKGYEVWDVDGKPHRSKTEAGLAHVQPRQDGKYGPDKVKEVWAALFWDVEAGTEKCFTFSQWGIKSGLREQITEWGTPDSGTVFDYDFVFVLATVNGKPGYKVHVADAAKGTARHPLPQEAQDSIAALYAAGFNLEALWEGGDPFPASGAATGGGVENDSDVPF